MDPENSEIDESLIITKDAAWRDRHVFQSQYLLQIYKCSNQKCCGVRRSSIFKFIPNGLPFPISLKQSDDGLKIMEVTSIEKYAPLFVTLALKECIKEMVLVPLQTKVIPYDMFCPSVQSKLESRTCICGRYFSSVSSMKIHLKSNIFCKKTIKRVKPLKIVAQKQDEKLVLLEYDGEEDVEWVYDMDVDTEEVFVEPEPQQTTIYGISTVLSPIWEQDYSAAI